MLIGFDKTLLEDQNHLDRMVQFEWNGVLYCCFGCISPAADTAPKMVICQAGSVEVNTRTEKWCDTADEILEYMIGGDRLRDVITQVKVWERTI